MSKSEGSCNLGQTIILFFRLKNWTLKLWKIDNAKKNLDMQYFYSLLIFTPMFCLLLRWQHIPAWTLPVCPLQVDWQGLLPVGGQALVGPQVRTWIIAPSSSVTCWSGTQPGFLKQVMYTLQTNLLSFNFLFTWNEKSFCWL